MRATILDPRTVSTESLKLGDRVFVNRGLLIEGRGEVTIGDDVLIGPRVTLTTSTHEMSSVSRRAGKVVAGSIAIGDGYWIGAGVTVLPGVAIGRGCVVGAGAVVTRDCDQDTLSWRACSADERTLGHRREWQRVLDCQVTCLNGVVEPANHSSTEQDE